MVKKNILIVGNNISTQCLVKKISNYNNCANVFMTGTKDATFENVIFVDIRPDDISELLEFAVQNNIDLTIVTAKEAIKADIAGLFNANNQMIFAPEYACCKDLLDEALMKKLLYKLKIQTTKFGIFEKIQPACDYLKTAHFPLIIQANSPQNERDIFACPTVSVANIAINDLFFKENEKILIEEYQSGHRFTVWAITDGFKILPITTCSNEIFSDCPDGGYITLGSAATTPDNIITKEIENHVLNEILTPVIANFEKLSTPYLGIIGARCVINKDEIYTEKIYPLTEFSQASILFNAIEENLITLFSDCAIGSFADDYEEIKTNEYCSICISLFSRTEEKLIKLPNIPDDDCTINLTTKIYNGNYYTQKGFIGTISARANTISSAKRKLKQYMNELQIEGLKYRKDILIPS